MKTKRRAFTLVEVLVSVMIFSVSIYYILQIYSDRRADVVYIVERNNAVMQDTFFLIQKDLARYDKSEKSAYDLLSAPLRPTKDQSLKALKTLKRTIRYDEPIRIYMDEEHTTPVATVEKLHLKGLYSRTYEHLRMGALRLQ